MPAVLLLLAAALLKVSLNLLEFSLLLERVRFFIDVRLIFNGCLAVPCPVFCELVLFDGWTRFFCCTVHPLWLYFCLDCSVFMVRGGFRFYFVCAWSLFAFLFFCGPLCYFCCGALRLFLGLSIACVHCSLYVYWVARACAALSV